MSYFASRANRVVSGILFLLIGAPCGLLILIVMSGPKSGGIHLGQALRVFTGPLLLIIAAGAEIVGPRIAACIALAGGAALLVLFIPLFNYFGTLFATGILGIICIGAVVYPLVTILALLKKTTPE
jgi:hypothetical protein